MASKSAKSGKVGAGPGVQTLGQVKTTQTPVFGARVSKRGGRKSSRSSRSR